VKEYFLFDPLGEYLRPPFRGFQLIGGEYVPMAPSESGRRLHSEVLGLDLVAEGGTLRLYEPGSGKRLLTHMEAEAARREAEAARRKAEVAYQKAEVARQEAEVAHQEAEAARLLAEKKARQEAEARKTAETEILRLREELARLQKKE
jgi:multidrug efflux pump subunit AcrA (membrane-fusion protein)